MDKLKIIEDVYAAFGRGDVPFILERLSEDVQWEHLLEDNHGIPYLLPGRGRAHAQKFFESLASIELTRFEPVNLLTGANQVVALIKVTVINKKTGKRLDDYEGHVWTFDTEGRITAFRHLSDTHAHWLANQA